MLGEGCDGREWEGVVHWCERGACFDGALAAAGEDGEGHELVDALVETCVGVTFYVGDETEVGGFGHLDVGA